MKMKQKEELAYSRALVPKHNTLYKIIIAILVVVIILLICFYFALINNNEKPSGFSGEYIDYNINLNTDDISLEREVGVTQMKIDYVDNCNYTISYPEVGIEEIDNTIYEYAKQLKNNFLNIYKSEDEGAPIFNEHVDYKSYLESGDKIRIVFIDNITNDIDVCLSKKEYTHVFSLSNGEEIGSKRAVIDSTNDGVYFEPLEGESNSNFVLLFSGDVIKYAISATNIRTEKNESSDKLGLLEEGEAIEVVSGDLDWETVLYDGNYGYVKTELLTRKKNLHKIVELEVLDRGIDPNKPMVAITYDDGPNPNSTPRILDTIEQYGAVATFFDLGQLVNRYPEIVRREEAIGCEVGNHSYSHKNMNTLSDEEMQDEIKNSELAFIKALGHKTVLFRAPYGNANLKVKENWEYPLIKWNVDSLDWKTRNKTKILKEIRKINNFDGHIVLLHSIYGTTADATEVLIPELIEQGYQLVTVSELAFYKGHTYLETAKEYKSFMN